MKNFKILLTLLILLIGSEGFCSAWLNDLRNLYSNKQAIIYEINIRTFNSQDKDGDGIITKNEEKGNFINALRRLQELSEADVNTIKLMPVLPVGKTNAYGTAGSLYAPVSFSQIDPMLKSPKGVSSYEDMRRFINECHKKNIRVIVDLPCCAGYDLYLKNPSLFVKNSAGQPITPVDMEDVRVLNGGTENSINMSVYKLYSNFIKMMIDLSVDGISVSMPETKPASLWKKLIDEAHRRDSQMLFIAEVNPKSNEIFKGSVPIVSVSKLLEAGFDGYSGNYYNIKDLKDSLYNNVKTDISLSQKFANNKVGYANFVSYDTETPVISNGSDYVKMLIWFGSTLPLNIYYLDGFSTGDNYMYNLSNKKASYTLTDDNYYYMKRGQIDIYNFSRRVGGSDFEIYSDFVLANKFRNIIKDVLSKGNFVTFKTSNPNILSYGRSFNGQTLILTANTSNMEFEKVKIKIPRINNTFFATPIKVSANIPTVLKGEIATNMAPYEVQVLLFQNFEVK